MVRKWDVEEGMGVGKGGEGGANLATQIYTQAKLNTMYVQIQMIQFTQLAEVESNRWL